MPTPSEERRERERAALRARPNRPLPGAGTSLDDILAEAKRTIERQQQLDAEIAGDIERDERYRFLSENPEETYGGVARRTAQAAALPLSFAGGPVGVAAGGYFGAEGLSDLLDPESDAVTRAFGALAAIPGANMLRKGFKAFRGAQAAGKAAKAAQVPQPFRHAAGEVLEDREALDPRTWDTLARRPNNRAGGVERVRQGGSQPDVQPDPLMASRQAAIEESLGLPDSRVREALGTAGASAGQGPRRAAMPPVTPPTKLNLPEGPRVDVPPAREAAIAQRGPTPYPILAKMVANIRKNPVGPKWLREPEEINLLLKKGEVPDNPVARQLDAERRVFEGEVRAPRINPLEALASRGGGGEMERVITRGVGRRFVEPGERLGPMSDPGAVAENVRKGITRRPVERGDRLSPLSQPDDVLENVGRGVTRRFVEPKLTRSSAMEELAAGEETARRNTMFGGLRPDFKSMGKQRGERPVMSEKAIQELVARILKGGE